MTSAEVATDKPELPRLSLPRQRSRTIGFWISLAVHAAIVALLWSRRDLLMPTPRPGDPGFTLGGGGGGGGGGGERATYIIALPPPPPQAAAPTPVPPVVTPPREEIPVAKPVVAPLAPPDTVPTQVAAATPGQGTAAGTAGDSGSGGGTGGGRGTGSGTGAGPGSGSGTGGEGGNVRPPELKGLVLPFGTPPRDLRGKVIKVTFAITADGRVERFDTDPVIEDRGYYRKFSEVVLAFRFRPARGPDGQPVAVVFPMEFTLPTQ
ncbi:MAG TPA: hypothetical protein VJ847_02020 [Gemmatimonadales bacterium]|jgi:hypothetical protein|nr:hypothetical protein [Gemmatimonadales bacterium]